MDQDVAKRLRYIDVPVICVANKTDHKPLDSQADEFYRLQRIAYDHRVHVNILSYGHSSTAPRARKCRMDLMMSNGRRMDERRYSDIKPGAKRGYWKDFVAVFGPFLSGKCFKDGHRGAVAAPGFYLTFHESWPLKVRNHFNGSPDAYEAFKGSPVYAETFVNVLKDFIATAKREGRTKTGFQAFCFSPQHSLLSPELCASKLFVSVLSTHYSVLDGSFRPSSIPAFSPSSRTWRLTSRWEHELSTCRFRLPMKRGRDLRSTLDSERRFLT